MQTYSTSLQKDLLQLYDQENFTVKYGFLFIIFGDLGPEPIYYENIPIEETAILAKGTMLGIYLTVIVGQGTRETNTGLYGPFPWNETPDYNLFAFVFRSRNPMIQDPRAQQSGVLCFIVIFQHKDNHELMQARLAFEKTMERTFIFENFEDYPLLNDENIPIFISQIKSAIYRTVTEGLSMLREQAMDNILADNTLVFLSYYYIEGQKELAFSIIGTEEEFASEVKSTKNLNIDVVLGNLKSNKGQFGLIKFPEFNKIAIAVWNRHPTLNSFIEFIDNLHKATPLLEQYYSIK